VAGKDLGVPCRGLVVVCPLEGLAGLQTVGRAAAHQDRRFEWRSG
jgi:hypothetical protein